VGPAPAAPQPEGISASGVTKAYSATTGLFGVDLEVRPGTVTALLGPNGAGKTTAVRIVTTLLKPDAGEVVIAGHDALREPQKVRAIIGIAGQAVSVDNRLTGLENLTMFGRLCRLSKKGSRLRALSLLEQFGLAQAAKLPVKSYSGGMRRKLDLAVSLIVAPPVLFLDEPTSGLDPASRAALWGTISELAQGGSTVLLTTQYLEEADRLADDIVLIDEGRVVATGAPQELKASIGGARLELTMATDADVARLCTALAGLVIVTDQARRTVSVVLGGPGRTGLRDLAEALQRAIGAEAGVEAFSLHQASLDDVFFQLTGRFKASAAVKEPD
jgi:ABC-2 type transport system ATP-binding protein